jgi:hypothetical protein
LAFPEAGHAARLSASLRVIPLVVQLGLRLIRSPPLSLEELIFVESHLAFEHEIDGASQLLGQNGQGFTFVMFFLQAGEEFLSRRMIP